MTDTRAWPLEAARYWYELPFNLLGTCYLVLLSDALTAFPDSAQGYDDVGTYEIPAQGGYDFFAVSFETPLTTTTNSTAGVVEFDTGTATWQTNRVLTVAGFRWIVVCDGLANIVAVWDCGSAQALTATKLIMHVPESSVSPGVYPLVSFTRNLT